LGWSRFLDKFNRNSVAVPQVGHSAALIRTLVYYRDQSDRKNAMLGRSINCRIDVIDIIGKVSESNVAWPGPNRRAIARAQIFN
jgi:hypothetical protein